MQRVGEVKRQIPNPRAHIDSVFPQPSFLDFELVIKELQNELADEDEFKIIQPPVQLSETSYEVRLKNGTTIKCQQEITSEDLRLETNIDLTTSAADSKINESTFSNKFAKLATSLTAAECKAGRIKPGSDVKVYIKIEPNTPATQKMLEVLKKAYKDNGFTVLDNPPESNPRATSSLR